MYSDSTYYLFIFNLDYNKRAANLARMLNSIQITLCITFSSAYSEFDFNKTNERMAAFLFWIKFDSYRIEWSYKTYRTKTLNYKLQSTLNTKYYPQYRRV